MPDLSEAIKKAHNDLEATEQEAQQLQREVGPLCSIVTTSASRSGPQVDKRPHQSRHRFSETRPLTSEELSKSPHSPRHNQKLSPADNDKIID